MNQVAGPRVWRRWVRNAVTGNPQGRFGQGDQAQLGGTFVVDVSGTVRYVHRGWRSDDNPSNEEVLAAVAAATR
jgi:hypothetical protein